MDRGSSGRRLALSSVLMALATVGAAAGFAVAALAGTSVPKRVPPPLAARARDAATSHLANSRSAQPAGPWWDISKTTAVAPDQTMIASLTLPVGTYQLTATGSAWTTDGKGVQNVGCHLMVGTTSYADAYISLDGSSATQQAYALVDVLTFRSRTTAQVECLLGKSPVDGVTTQVNFVAIKT